MLYFVLNGMNDLTTQIVFNNYQNSLIQGKTLSKMSLRMEVVCIILWPISHLVCYCKVTKVYLLDCVHKVLHIFLLGVQITDPNTFKIENSEKKKGFVYTAVRKD